MSQSSAVRSAQYHCGFDLENRSKNPECEHHDQNWYKAGPPVHEDQGTCNYCRNEYDRTQEARSSISSLRFHVSDLRYLSAYRDNLTDQRVPLHNFDVFSKVMQKPDGHDGDHNHCVIGVKTESGSYVQADHNNGEKLCSNHEAVGSSNLITLLIGSVLDAGSVHHHTPIHRVRAITAAITAPAITWSRLFWKSRAIVHVLREFVKGFPFSFKNYGIIAICQYGIFNPLSFKGSEGLSSC
jgi:hypothetical protein